MRDAIHAHKFTGNRPKGTGKLIGCEGAMAEQNYRAATTADDERFVAALQKARQEELRTALLVTCELHKPPTGEEITAFERAMALVKAGASISEVIPFKRRGDPQGTLAGNSMAWVG